MTDVGADVIVEHGTVVVMVVSAYAPTGTVTYVVVLTHGQSG